MRERRPGANEVASLKGRIAEAFVETIFQRAGYAVSRIGRESQVQRLVKLGGDEFLPDFLLRKLEPGTDAGRPLHRLIPIEVKYRANAEGFLAEHGEELLPRIGDQWPERCLVLVTDHPAPGRSCFQVVDLSVVPAEAPLGSVDLHEVRDLDVYETTVREYEGLVRGIFPMLRLGAA